MVVINQGYLQLKNTKNPLKDNNGGLITEAPEIEKIMFETFFEANHLLTGNFDEEFYHTINRLYSDIIEDDDLEELENEDQYTKALNRDISIEEIMNSIKNTKCSGKT